MRALAILDKEENSFLPGIKTAGAQGYNIISSSSRDIASLADMPRDVVNRLSASIQKGMKDEQHISKMTESGFPLKYMGPDEFRKHWDDLESHDDLPGRQIRVNRRVEPLLTGLRQSSSRFVSGSACRPNVIPGDSCPAGSIQADISR